MCILLLEVGWSISGGRQLTGDNGVDNTSGGEPDEQKTQEHFDDYGAPLETREDREFSEDNLLRLARTYQ